MSVQIDNISLLYYAENMEKTILAIQSAGLSEKSARVYLTLLELGGAFPSQIAKYTKLQRSTVYEILADLSIKGLISEIKKRNKYFYTIEDPKRLLHFSERSLVRAQENNEKFREFLPELEGFYRGTTDKPKVSYFEGTEGVTEIYEDHISIKEKYEMLGFVNVAELMRFLPQEKYREYVRKKEKLGITTRGILPDTTNDRAYEEMIYKSARQKILPQVRFIPKEEFPWKGDITIYGSKKISIINFDERQATGIIIESETIYKMMRMIFELAWKGASDRK